MSETLPTFRYHPDPIRSGSIAPSTKKCQCCTRSRGFIYTGPAYAEEELDDALCPWCIADGSAAKKFDVSFTDSASFPDAIPERAGEEIERRTPGFSAWQEPRWLACCGDGAAFIAPAGHAELLAIDYQLEGQLMGHIVHEMGISGGAATRLLASLKKDEGPTAYVFRCLTCGTHLAYIDMP